MARIGFAPETRIYVRENWKAHSTFEGLTPSDIPQSNIFYTADQKYSPSGSKQWPSIYMPRWASRITLGVTEVRIQRLQDISADDCHAEGHQIAPHISADPAVHDDAARDWYSDLWESLHTDPGTRWADNPWLIAYTFTVENRNIDQENGK